MMYDFDTPVDRTNTSSLKWDKYRDQDVIPLWVADMDFRSPEPVLAALNERVDHGVFGYTSAPEELIETIVARCAKFYDWHIEPDWLVFLQGVVPGLNMACRAIGDECDSVITTTPVYFPFLRAPGLARRELISVPMLLSNGRWEFDFDRIRSAITDRTRVLLLCSPFNPIGRVLTRDELSEISAICLERNIIVCSDEIHCDLVLDAEKKHIPTASLSREVLQNTITFMSTSKTFNLAGAGCAFAVIQDDDLRDRFEQSGAGIAGNISALSYAAMNAAYSKCESWRQSLIAYLKENRDLLQYEIDNIPGLSMTHVEATYLAWIDASDLTDSPQELFLKAGVGLSDGVEFGGAGYVRLNFGCSRSLLEEALRRIRTALT